MLIKFEFDKKGWPLTECPHKVPSKLTGNVSYVGSMGCQRCVHFEYRYTEEVDCSFGNKWIPLSEEMLMCLDCESRYGELSDASVCPACGGKRMTHIELAYRILSEKEAI